MDQNPSKENGVSDTKNQIGDGADLETRPSFPQIFAASDISAMRALVEKVFGPIRDE